MQQSSSAAHHDDAHKLIAHAVMHVTSTVWVKIVSDWPKVLSWMATFTQQAVHEEETSQRSEVCLLVAVPACIDMNSQNRSQTLHGHVIRQTLKLFNSRALAIQRCSSMSSHPAWLLVLCLLLATLLIMTTPQQSSSRMVTSGASRWLSWADPWIDQWVAEQEHLQAPDPAPGMLPCSGLWHVSIPLHRNGCSLA